MKTKEAEGPFKFDVFISYRHAELDNAVAGYLQKALEHYRIPRELKKKSGKQRIRRVFRDEEELGVASDLFGEIEQNLRESEFLLVICSPRYVESKWCRKEIETFIKYRGRENILAVLIEGEPEASFPPELLEEGEPLAADLRGRNKKEVRRNARKRLPRLVAPLLSCSFDELYQRQRVYRMRRMLALAGLAVAVALGFGAAMGKKNQEINQNYRKKLENQSRYLAQLSGSLLNGGDREAALLVALEALPGSSSTDADRPYVAEARMALEEALYTYETDTVGLMPRKVLEHKSTVADFADYQPEEQALLTGDSQGRLYVWDGETLENLCCLEDLGLEFQDARLVGNHQIVAQAGNGLYCLDYTTSRLLWQWELPVCDGERGVCYSKEICWDYNALTGAIICGNRDIQYHPGEDGGEPEITDNHVFYKIQVSTGEIEKWEPVKLYESLNKEDAYDHLDIRELVLSPDGEQLAITWMDEKKYPYEAGYVQVLPVSGEGDGFFRDYTDFPIIDHVAWLDEEHLGVVRIEMWQTTFGVAAVSRPWKLDCWNVKDQELRLHYEDTALSIREGSSLQKIRVEKELGEAEILSVIFGNVEVCLDWNTGERYTRVEDRSPLVLNRIVETSAQILVTEDGHVFATNALADLVWSMKLDNRNYYLNFGTVERGEYYQGKYFFFSGLNVYCYEPKKDGDGVLLEQTPQASWFTQDSAYAVVQGRNGKIFLYDTQSLKLLWEEECYGNISHRTAGLLEDRFVVYLSGDGDRVESYSMQEGEKCSVSLENGLASQSSVSWNWYLRPAGPSCVLVWSNAPVFTSHSEEELMSTAVWLVDVEQGQVLEQWSCQDLMGQISNPQEEALTIQLDTAALTADGRFLILPCTVSPTWDSQVPEVFRLLIWDRETKEFLDLPKELVQGLASRLPSSSYYFCQDGWLAPEGSLLVLYDQEGRKLRVVDVEQEQVLGELSVDGIGSDEVSFTPDGDHLIFQDSRRCLQVYDWKADTYTMSQITPEEGSLSFDFYQNGQVLSAFLNVGGNLSETSRIYERTGEGLYRLDSSVGPSGGCDGKTVVIWDENRPRLCHFYSLEDLIARAGEILNGRELTEVEREAYLID